MCMEIHRAVVLLLFTVASSHAVKQKAKEAFTALVTPDIAPYIGPAKKEQSGGGGGGGDRSPLPANKGKLPKPAMRQVTPPTAVVNKTEPKIMMEPTHLPPPDPQPPT